jgi:hypothetical protein
MRTPRPHYLAIALAALFAITLSGCTQTTPIKTLLDDPAHFDHQTVGIAGTVKESVGVMGYGAYQVNDGTGTLTVLTQQGGAPRDGAKVSVSGEFRAGFTLGTETAAVLMEKERKTQ